jgi:dTMP kinase
MEGAGKSTLLESLNARLLGMGRATLLTREPGGSELGRGLRAALLAADSRLNPEAELFLFLADRAQHVSERIRPALKRGLDVLCDRYVDSTLAYQGFGRGLDVGKVRELCALATGNLWPDVTLVLDIGVDEGLRRAMARHQSRGSLEAEGRFETCPREFHHRIRQGFLELAAREPARLRVLDASLPPPALLEAAWSELRRFYA